MLGCCLPSFHFLSAILCPQSVVVSSHFVLGKLHWRLIIVFLTPSHGVFDPWLYLEKIASRKVNDWLYYFHHTYTCRFLECVHVWVTLLKIRLFETRFCNDFAFLRAEMLLKDGKEKSLPLTTGFRRCLGKSFSFVQFSPVSKEITILAL